MVTNNTLDYYVNPFFHNHTQPKLGDGKFNTSIGCSITRAGYYKSDDTLAATYQNRQGLNEYVILIHPGLTQSMTLYQLNNVKENESNYLPTDLIYRGEVVTNDFGIWVPDEVQNKAVLNNAPNAWRIISKGAIIDVTSSDHESAGYFESINVHAPNNSSEVLIPGLQETNRSSQVRVKNDWIVENINGWKNHINSKTFHSGTLKDLNNRFFQQPVFNVNHDPTDLDSTYRTDRELYRLHDVYDKHFNWFIVRLTLLPGNTWRYEDSTNYEMSYPITNGIRTFEMDAANDLVERDLNNANQQLSKITPDNVPLRLRQQNKHTQIRKNKPNKKARRELSL